MERRDFQTVGDVLRQALEESRMTDRLDEVRAAAAWEAVVGTHIASLTARPWVSKGIMTVRTPDASLRQELMMSRSALVRNINAAVGRQVITDIRFTS
ncbi:MAG: DUF721 domain-containing protein [Muribaculaceae bacterium]|nr:DUF721 domain-containing protein [Muribaculaceae bacterium]